jgi:hypothetical protein
LTPLVMSLDTPDKATVAGILADPNGHGIYFRRRRKVTELSEFDLG